MLLYLYMKQTTPRELHKLMRENKIQNDIVIDVREPGEYRREHILHAKNMPLGELEENINALKKYKKVYVGCQSGGRSAQACELLDQAGLKNIIDIKGGLHAWDKYDLPTVKGEGMISVVRQTRFVIGLMVLIGFFGGMYLWWPLYILTVIAGVGLVFAGLTGTCGMMVLIRHMPWNKK